MMRRFLAVLPVLLLAACAAPMANPVPKEVRLTNTELALRLSDGTLCKADWRAAPVGRLEGCGPGYGYAVKVEDNPNLLRQMMEGVVLALGGTGVLAPMAEVVITDPAGIDQVFSLPEKHEPERG